MIKSNETPVLGVRNITSSRKEKMAIFDALPKRLRRMCNYAPFNLSPLCMTGYNQAVIVVSLRRELEKLAPGWTPLKGDPEP